MPPSTPFVPPNHRQAGTKQPAQQDREAVVARVLGPLARLLLSDVRRGQVGAGQTR
jgi:hypothetical protein